MTATLLLNKKTCLINNILKLKKLYDFTGKYPSPRRKS